MDRKAKVRMQRHKTPPKDPFIKIHAKRRVAERLEEIPPTGKTLSGIRKMIQDHQSIVIRHQSASIKHHLLTYNGQRIVAVYDKRRHLIKTVWKYEEE